MLIKREEQYLLIIAFELYLLNKYCLCKFLTNYFMRCYFNDVMGGIVFGIMIRIANRFWFKREITFWLYELLFVIAGIYWECIAPLYIKYSVGDVGDIAAYFGGGLCLLLLLEILGGRKMKCRNCGEELRVMTRFCPKCGSKIEQKRYCTECGAELKSSARFCSSCGTPVIKKNIKETAEVNLLDENRVFIKKDKNEGSGLQREIVLEEGQNVEKEVVDDLKEIQEALEEKQDETENGSGWQMKVGIPSMETKIENETSHLVYERKGKLVTKRIIAGCAAIFIVGGVLLYLWAGRRIELSDYIFLPKEDITKLISEQKLIDEDDIGIYHNDGLLLMLTEQGTIYSIAIQSPEYELYGITVGDEFIESEIEKNFLDKGFGFLDKIEGVKENHIRYGILREGKPDNEHMIEIRTDENNTVVAVAYARNNSETYEELGIELEEDLDDNDGGEYIGENNNNTETKNRWDKIKETASGMDSVSNDSKAVKLAKQYEGEWWDLNSQRCHMNIKAAGGNKLSIIVSWSSGYANDSKWEMTGQINGVNGKIIYNDCTQYDLDYNKNDAEQRTINYTNGSGYFYLGNDGYLYWEDEMEYAGAGCYFEKDSGSTETQDTTNYTANVPLGSGTTMYVVQCKASITLRNAPTSNAAEITQIPLYASVEYFGTLDNGFAQVAYNGQIGYVLGSYLDYYEPQAYTGIKCQIVNCKQSVTLRTSITAQDKEICQIPLGTVIDYIDEGANGYCLVNYNGMMGYVKYEYLLFL